MKHSLDREDWRHGGFGLYVHWPFCQSKCPYCDFNSHVVQAVDQTVWLDAYVSEIDRVGAQTEGRILRSVFFGGGTPSLMLPGTVQGILDAVRRTWRLANDCEITLEANPGSVEAARFQGYAEAGVNRVSLGFQALDDLSLRRLGRQHSVAEAMDALHIAQSVFDRVSVDLIYARQDQTLAEWEAELRKAVALGTEHLSLYQLTIEDGTVFARRHAVGQLPGLPHEDLAANMFEMTQALTAEAGYSAYEVSNHARPGAESRHNMIYWTGGDYAGIGPGAHGRLTLRDKRWATVSHRAPADWLQAVSAGSGENERNDVPLGEQAMEYLIMGLRTSAGLDLARLAGMAGTEIPTEVIADLQAMGLVTADAGTLRATQNGRAVLNAIIRELAPHLEGV